MVVEKQKAILDSLIGDTDGPLPPWAKKSAGAPPAKPEGGKTSAAASASGGVLPPWARGQAASAEDTSESCSSSTREGRWLATSEVEGRPRRDCPG